MLTALSLNLPHSPRSFLHLHQLQRSFASALMLAVCMLATACTPPTLPNPTPTKEEVPFLGQQMTQEQIAQWRQQVSTQRAQNQQTWSEEKQACYQRFAVNACLRKGRRHFLQKEAVLRKQDIELNRQSRVLTEIDKQLRLKEKGVEQQ